jgi:hypothetical protein
MPDSFAVRQRWVKLQSPHKLYFLWHFAQSPSMDGFEIGCSSCDYNTVEYNPSPERDRELLRGGPIGPCPVCSVTSILNGC